MEICSLKAKRDEFKVGLRKKSNEQVFLRSRIKKGPSNLSEGKSETLVDFFTNGSEYFSNFSQHVSSILSVFSIDHTPETNPNIFLSNFGKESASDKWIPFGFWNINRWETNTHESESKKKEATSKLETILRNLRFQVTQEEDFQYGSQALAAGVQQLLVQVLLNYSEDGSIVQNEAALALSALLNIPGTSQEDTEALLSAGLVQAVLKLFASQSPEIFKKGLWIVGTSSLNLLIGASYIQNGILGKMEAFISTTKLSEEIVGSLAWCMSILCHSGAISEIDMVHNIFKELNRTCHKMNENDLINTLWSFYFLAKHILEINAWELLNFPEIIASAVGLLKCESSDLLHPSIKIIVRFTLFESKKPLKIALAQKDFFKNLIQAVDHPSSELSGLAIQTIGNILDIKLDTGSLEIADSIRPLKLNMTFFSKIVSALFLEQTQSQSLFLLKMLLDDSDAVSTVIYFSHFPEILQMVFDILVSSQEPKRKRLALEIIDHFFLTAESDIAESESLTSPNIEEFFELVDSYRPILDILKADNLSINY